MTYTASLNGSYNTPTRRKTTKLLPVRRDLPQKQRHQTEDEGHLLGAVPTSSVAVAIEYMQPEAAQPEATQPVYQLVISVLLTDITPGVPGVNFPDVQDYVNCCELGRLSFYILHFELCYANYRIGNFAK